MAAEASYGTWKSPLGAADIVERAIGFAEIAVDGETLYWIEMRPAEQGRQVLVRRSPDGAIDDLTPEPVNVRTRVHEYGGGAVSVGHGRVVYSDFPTQQLWSITGDEAKPITSEPLRPASDRFADGRILSDGRMVCVRESHPEEGEARNELVMITLETGEVSVLATGRDFYAAPRAGPGENRLSWIEWDHPNMPWDGTELKAARMTAAGLSDVVTVAGGSEESIVGPDWAPDGTLVFATDRSGYWNLHRWDGESVPAIVSRDADFADPAWLFGRSPFGFLSDGRILGGYWEDGTHHLVVISADGEARALPDDLSIHSRITTDGKSRAWFVGAGPQTPSGLFEIDVDTGEMTSIRSNPHPVEPAYNYEPRPVTFPTGEGEVAHAIFYPPNNPGFEAPDGELPPLIVQIHGGPTSQVAPVLDPDFLYWTTRGLGLVDVNYRGSTGYGRSFRNRLRGEWGIVDVEDALAAARFLADTGEVDGGRLVITGGSAGGYTTLAALAFGDAFSAGASYYGVADIELLARHTHKFESRYLDGLVGTDPELMRERSPLYSADQIDVPVILFQGLEDRVVPPEQAEEIAAALDSKGVPYAHITYEGEDHGFRQGENIIHSLESELAFYGLVLGFTPAGDLPTVPVVGDLSG